jgi:hypothetical protein
MTVHLVNPSPLSFGTSVITPRWLYVLAAATPARFGDPKITDEMLYPFDPAAVSAGDVVGVGIHTGNALRGYEIGRAARERGATVIFGGIHATLFPDEARQLGGAHAVVRGDGDLAWPEALNDNSQAALKTQYEAGRIAPENFQAARWDLLPKDRYMWASVQTVRGCPKHCSFCSVWRTDGQKPRMRQTRAILGEIVDLRRRGFRFILLADDNFYPVSLKDVELAERQGNQERISQLSALRSERLAFMDALAQLPNDMVFFTQITMEAGEDTAFLDAMQRARIRGALVGIEAVTPEGLKDVYKDFNFSGEGLVERMQTFRQHGVSVLGSFIFGLPSDKAETFHATAELADRAQVAFAQFVMLTPLPGTVDFARWETSLAQNCPTVDGIPITRHWLIPPEKRPKIYSPHPHMSADEIRRRTQGAWDEFYSLPRIWHRAQCVKSLKARAAFVLISKLYRQMYANTGIATDSARVSRSAKWASWIARPCRRLFSAKPMPQLAMPELSSKSAA